MSGKVGLNGGKDVWLVFQLVIHGGPNGHLSELIYHRSQTECQETFSHFFKPLTCTSSHRVRELTHKMQFSF